MFKDETVNQQHISILDQQVSKQQRKVWHTVSACCLLASSLPLSLPTNTHSPETLPIRSSGSICQLVHHLQPSYFFPRMRSRSKKEGREGMHLPLEADETDCTCITTYVTNEMHQDQDTHKNLQYEWSVNSVFIWSIYGKKNEYIQKMLKLRQKPEYVWYLCWINIHLQIYNV